MFRENRAIFLDRDGILNFTAVKNGKSHPPLNLKETIINPSAKLVLPILKQEGYLLIGITNQPDVVRGEQKQEVIEEINNHLLNCLPLTEIFVCYHDNEDNCNCRKPKPGLIFQAAQKYKISLTNSYMIGDRWKDIEAGKCAGCKTIFIDYKYNEGHTDTKPDYSVDDISEIIEIIIPNRSK